jgi:hypothetical protein
MMQLSRVARQSGVDRGVTAQAILEVKGAKRPFVNEAAAFRHGYRGEVVRGDAQLDALQAREPSALPSIYRCTHAVALSRVNGAET